MSTSLERLARSMTGAPEGLLLAGLSGGADSVALLRLLHLRCGPERLRAVHVNHGLRGAASDGDEAFCRVLCGQLGVPLDVVRVTLPADCSEGEAREQRYAAFARVYRERQAGALVLAHHLEDQAETVLMHLLRGSGSRGLAGMAEHSRAAGMHIWRPLLRVSRRELRDALTGAGQPWREDASNLDPRFLRNRVRQELLPAMERISPGAGRRIATAADLMALDEAYWTRETGRFLGEHAGVDWLHIAPWEALHPALRQRVVRAWWAQAAPVNLQEKSLSARQTEEILALPENGWLNLPGGLRLYRGRHCLHLLPEGGGRGQASAAAAENRIPEGIRLTRNPSMGEPGDGALAQEVPADWGQDLTLRVMAPGDWIRPFGSGHRRELGEYLRERDIDLPFRGRIPLLCRGREVLLAAGVGAGDVPPYSPDRANVRLTWQGAMPWRLR